jgi:sugar/nucleoside kinase (ribokinase family)
MGTLNIARAARGILALGPRAVVVKRGEHGATLYTGSSTFLAPAYPIDEVVDPTGAGDTFAGGLAGYLAGQGADEVDFALLRRAVIFGSVLASFNVEAFSLNRLRNLTSDEIDERYEMFRLMSQFEVLP